MQVIFTVGIAIAASCAVVIVVVISLLAWRRAALRKAQLTEERQVNLRIHHHGKIYTTSEELGTSDSDPAVSTTSSSVAHLINEDKKRRNTLAQLENVVNQENCDSPTEESSYTSAGDDVFDVFSTSREIPQLEFSLVFASATNCFNVHIIRAVNLPSKYIRNCESYAKVILTEGCVKKFVRSTRIFKGSLNPEYEECFSFPGCTLQSIQESSIRFSVYVKVNVLKRFKRIGDVVFHVTEAKLMPDEPMIYLERLTFYKRSKHFKERNSSNGELGFVFLSLQYQPHAERLKVLIRKAENLPKESGVNIVPSEYYIIIHLMKGIEEVSRKETSSAIGPNPIWNHAFLFDLNPQEQRHYWLQFVLMKGKKYQRQWPLGKFLIGAKTTATGIAHWNEAMEPRAHETARWHCIL